MRVSLCTGDRERPGSYFSVAALNLMTSSAGTRPRSFTSMPCALAHSRTSVVYSPLARAPRLPRAGRRVPAPGPAGSMYIARQRLLQRLGMLGVQVDLILGAVQPEADGAFGLGAVKVVDIQDLYLLGHGCSIPLPDLACQCMQIQAAQTSSRADVPSPSRPALTATAGQSAVLRLDHYQCGSVMISWCRQR